jgi:hypothetical protein
MDLSSLRSFENLISLNKGPHEMMLAYTISDADIRANFKGNQGGGTCISMNDVALRCCGMHPLAKRNKNLEKPIRCVSKVKPQGPDDEENQQYVEFKRIFPYEFIKQDITARSSIMTVRDPKGGANKKVEFMASTQDLDAFMSVQRSALYQDEEIEYVKWDESQMRLLKAGGDATITLTPVKGMDWVFDRIWKRARKINRSRTICEKFGFQSVEVTDSSSSIEAFCWATDDNPCMTKESIDRIFAEVADEDDLAMRRYGVFRQVSGRIYKAFDKNIHVVPQKDVFSADLFSKYWNYRIVDFHPQKPWAVSYVVVTPTNEWFVWNELWAKHEHKTTLEMRDEIKAESVAEEDSEYNRATLIDPLSTMKQHSSENEGTTVFDDLKRGEQGIHRLMCADTKNTQGRMEIKKRLKNSLQCQYPGNNINKTDQVDPRYGDYLPTLWFLDNCKGHIEHFNSWRMVDYKQDHVKATRIIKRESEKYSDYPRNIEFLACLCPVWYNTQQSSYEPSRLFQGRRAA